MLTLQHRHTTYVGQRLAFPPGLRGFDAQSGKLRLRFAGFV
jgi:hypothetical protein